MLEGGQLVSDKSWASRRLAREKNPPIRPEGLVLKKAQSKFEQPYGPLSLNCVLSSWLSLRTGIIQQEPYLAGSFAKPSPFRHGKSDFSFTIPIVFYSFHKYEGRLGFAIIIYVHVARALFSPWGSLRISFSKMCAPLHTRHRSGIGLTCVWSSTGHLWPCARSPTSVPAHIQRELQPSLGWLRDLKSSTFLSNASTGWPCTSCSFRPRPI